MEGAADGYVDAIVDAAGDGGGAGGEGDGAESGGRDGGGPREEGVGAQHFIVRVYEFDTADGDVTKVPL